ncbi:GNAT family N-acetyltransferase [Streptomyces longwoodensis]|jgi:ribosomal-protein-alanine N-acetyltransferase|uniref:GNAT family N-acetyltransferase n=1 Tax=Streptomyces lasalocidi TaxID=324833 RepID=A0A4U5WFS4_STRLS|nr:GNAT family N-acetyltransferase [Streptomyces lasalocidi]
MIPPRDRYPSTPGSFLSRTARNRPPRIRAVTETDLPDIVRVDKEAFPAAPYPFFVVRQFFDAFREHMFVLEDGDGELRGYVMSTGTDDAESWILSLAVTAEVRRQGWGRQLMTEVLSHLRGRGAHTVVLSVEPDNATAVALYDSLGFTPAPGGPVRDYFGPGEHRLLMTLAL